MKTKFSLLVFVLSLAIGSAATVSDVDGVQFTRKQVILSPAGTVLKAPDVAALPFGIVVETNGTFTVNKGKARELQEGDVLGKDGLLIKADGRVMPVMDHVTLNRGRVLLVKDGEATEVRELVQLGDGTIIAPDWKITPRNGTPRRLMDGEFFLLEGNPLPARDSVTMRGGKVLVQKDGTTLEVPANRTIMMNDGTKVFWDGTIVTFDGTRSAVTEGERVILQGVVTRPR
jgi:hypothetical protein